MPENTQQSLAQLFLQRPETMEHLLGEISPAIFAALKLAVEIGKWEDGKKLKQQQLELCMQAIILYEARHFPKHERTGFEPGADCVRKKIPEQQQTITVDDQLDRPARAKSKL